MPASLTTVTTFSKIIAMVLFILLPFGGFYFGMTYQQRISSATQVYSPTHAINPKLTFTQQPTSTTSAQPSDGTTNWKTYTNPKFGFQLKSPENTQVNEKSDGVDIIVEPGVSMSVGSGALFRVEVINNSQNLSLEDVHKAYVHYACNTENGGKCERVTINGYGALKASGFVTIVGNEAYYIQKGVNVFRLTWQYNGDDKRQIEIGSQILSTFKFTN